MLKEGPDLSLSPQVNMEHVANFIRVAQSLMKNGIHFKKATLKSLNLVDNLYYLAQEKLGKDYNFLHASEESIRLYVHDLFGSEGLNYFTNSASEVVADTEKALLFYHAYRQKGHPDLDTLVAGVTYYVIAYSLEKELELLLKLSTKGIITPSFECHAQFFRWKRCPYVLRRYMLALSIPAGYKGYVFDRGDLTRIGYLHHRGKSFHDSVAELEPFKKEEKGAFIDFLPFDLENLVLPSLLRGDIDAEFLSDMHAESFQNSREVIEQIYTIDGINNVYNIYVKQHMIDIIGKIIGAIQKEAADSSAKYGTDWFFYHLSESRFGIAVKEELTIESIIPNLSAYMKEVQPLDISKTLVGEFL